MYGGYIIKLERIGSGLNAFRIYKYMKFKIFITLRLISLKFFFLF